MASTERISIWIIETDAARQKDSGYGTETYLTLSAAMLLLKLQAFILSYLIVRVAQM